MNVDPKEVWNEEYWLALEAGKDRESAVKDAEAVYGRYIDSLREEAEHRTGLEELLDD